MILIKIFAFLVFLVSVHNLWIHGKDWINGKKRDGWRDVGDFSAILFLIYFIVAIVSFVAVFVVW